jgi:hypothetical protein
MKDFGSLKIYSPGCQAIDWGFGYDQLVDLETALAQPTSIAAVPVFCDNPQEFSYLPQYRPLDLSRFDLVLFTDIQFRSQAELEAWILTTGARQWLLSVAGLHDRETLHETTIYRPTWMFTFLQWNPPRDSFPLQRPYLFDCLCGTRREQRDFAMLSLIKSGLIDQGIATYRDIFPGHEFEQTPVAIQKLFDPVSLPWPYVSGNLQPEWEVRTHLDNSISSDVPWQIYDRTWFTMLMETIGDGEIFLAAEKIGKCLQARRLFVHFGRAGWLEKLQALGFETFATVIDESYDQIQCKYQRWQAAFEQVQYLCAQDLTNLLPKIKPVLDHNHHRLYQYRDEIKKQMQDLIGNYLK